MEIKVREFEFGDIPKLSKILAKIGAKDALKQIFAKPDIQEKDVKKKAEAVKRMQEEFGAEFAALIITSIWQAEPEINAFVASLTNQSVDEVTHMKPDKIKAIIAEIGKTGASLTDFFKLAAK